MIQLGTAWSKLRWSLAQRGLAGTMRSVLGHARRRNSATSETKPLLHPFDLRYGVDTSGLIGGGELRSGHKNDVFNTAYYGMAPSRFRQVMADWLSDGSHGAISEYSFIDLGCGKGRAVMMASEFPFRQVIGVERSAREDRPEKCRSVDCCREGHLSGADHMPGCDRVLVSRRPLPVVLVQSLCSARSEATD